MFLEKKFVKTQNPLMEWYKTKIEVDQRISDHPIKHLQTFVHVEISQINFKHENYERKIGK